VNIKPPLSGEELSSSQWFQPVSKELQRLSEPTELENDPGQAQAAQIGVESGRLVGEQSDTITVTRDNDGELVTVAKPPNLRGNIATRINAAGGTEEIFRSYFPNNVILFASVTDTGVADVKLADLNWAARRWVIEII